MTPRLHQERRGQGPSLVFTHGLDSSSEAWRPVAERLSTRGRTVCWDLRGHGRSAAPAYDGAYTEAAALGDLAAVVAELHPPAVLLGHSLGGYLTLAHAIAHPGTTAALVLVATGPGFARDDRLARWNERMGRLQRVGQRRAGLAVMTDTRVSRALPEVHIPTLVVAGDGDANYAAACRYLADRLPDATLVEVAGAGHNVHTTHPDQVVALVEAFLDRHGILPVEVRR